jgi:hypothetical protein
MKALFIMHVLKIILKMKEKQMKNTETKSITVKGKITIND